MPENPAADYYQRQSRACAGAIVWQRRVTGGAAEVLPDGCMDLLWIGGRLLVAGPDTRAYLSGAAAGAMAYGIRFAPGAAPALLGVRADELLDRRVELADLWSGARARAMADVVAAAPDPLRGLERVACVRAADAEPPDPLLGRLVARLNAGAPVAVTAEELGVGARRLHRLSLSAFGYGPKMLARILRMHRALESARTGIGLAETAALAGYADQAHMTRDFRALTGRSPARVLGGDIAADQPSGA